MAPPVRVAGRVTGVEPTPALQTAQRITQYVNPYIRAGWDNWKLALAEAEMWAKQDASEYEAKLKRYETLFTLRKQLEGDLAKLQLEAQKAGQDAALTVFKAAQDAALQNAEEANRASRDLFEQGELNKRATADNILSKYKAELGEAGVNARAVFSETAETQRFNVNEQNQATNAGTVGRSSKKTDLGDPQNPQIYANAYAAYDPNNPASINNVIATYNTQVESSQASNVVKDKGGKISDLARLVLALQADSRFGTTVDPSLLSGDNAKLVIEGAQFNAEGGPRNMSYEAFRSGANRGPVQQAPMPGGIGPLGVPSPEVGVSAPSRGPTVTQAEVVGTLEKPDFAAAQAELEKKLSDLEVQLGALDLKPMERTSLIDTARKIYGEKFRGFPGAIREPVGTDRWASVKLAAAKRAKELEGLYRTDASDPLNQKALQGFLGSLSGEVTSTIDRLFSQKTDKTDPSVIPSSIMKLYSSRPKQLEDAMTYYLYKKKREEAKVPTQPTPAPAITEQPASSQRVSLPPPPGPSLTVGNAPVYIRPPTKGQ